MRWAASRVVALITGATSTAIVLLVAAAASIVLVPDGDGRTDEARPGLAVSQRAPTPSGANAASAPALAVSWKKARVVVPASYAHDEPRESSRLRTSFRAPGFARTTSPVNSRTDAASVEHRPPGRSGSSTSSVHDFRAARGVPRIDDALKQATTVRGRFGPTAEPGSVLVRRDPVTGSPTHYQVYGPDGLLVTLVDLTGRAHGGVPAPHVVEYQRNVNPDTGVAFVRPNRHVRPANPDEIPG